MGQSVLFGVTCSGATRSGGAGGASGPVGQQGRWQTGADGATVTEWTGVESDQLGRKPRCDVTGKSGVRAAFYGPVGTSHRFTTPHYKGGGREIHSYYELSNPSYNEYI